MLILAAGLWSLVYGIEPIALGFVAVGFWGTSEIWRGVRVTGDQLIAQGRVSRRTLPLAEFRQVGRGRMGTVWVQPRTGRTLVLHQAEIRTDVKGDSADVVGRLRELAEEGGADLEPEVEDPTSPPKPSTPFFGW